MIFMISFANARTQSPRMRRRKRKKKKAARLDNHHEVKVEAAESATRKRKTSVAIEADEAAGVHGVNAPLPRKRRKMDVNAGGSG